MSDPVRVRMIEAHIIEGLSPEVTLTPKDNGVEMTVTTKSGTKKALIPKGDTYELKNEDKELIAEMAFSEYAETAHGHVLESEGHAVGKQDGVDVDSSSPYYHNNAKYYAEQAADSNTAAQAAKTAAQEAAATASAAYGTDLLAPDFSTSSTYAVGDYVIHSGDLYRCTTAVTTAGEWNNSMWTQVAVGGEVGALKSAINDLENETKWTDEATDVLDALGSAIPFTTVQGGELWDNLISILRGTFVGHSVVWSGSNYTASNTSTHIADESSYSCTVTPVEGFVISALTVTMGNAAIVPTQNQDGTYSITIASVTDDVVIAVTTSLDPSALIYHIENFTCDGNQTPIETPLEFGSTTANGVTDAWTLCATATGASDVGEYCFVFSTLVANTRLSLDTYNNTATRIRVCGTGEEYSKINKLKGMRVSVVVTHDAGSQTDLTIHYINKTSGEYESNTFTGSGVNALSYSNGATPLRIGASYNDSGKFKGTINDITIYHRVLSSQEIEAYLLGGGE